MTPAHTSRSVAVIVVLVTLMVALPAGFSAAAPNNPPVAADNSYAAISGVTKVIGNPGVIGNDTDPDGDLMEPVLVTGPSHAASFTLNTPPWGFTYLSEPGFVGTDTFTYQAQDAHGALSNTATVTIVVSAPPNNASPTAVDDSYTTQAGQPLAVSPPGILANDTDPDGNELSLDSYDTSTITHGVISVVSDGAFSYFPDPGFTGTEFFQYQPKDPYGGQGAPATVTITVLAAPSQPTTPANPTTSNDPDPVSRTSDVLPATGGEPSVWVAILSAVTLSIGILLVLGGRPRRIS